jgi:acid phosphatase family membrane protein YuiD
MDITYVLAPFLAWFVAGILKFTINSLMARKLAFGLIGYGGLPSNHSAIVASMPALIAFKEGIGNPAFGIAITLAFIVVLDAHSLRRQLGKHAEALNRLTLPAQGQPALRERMGHTRIEITAGILVGIGVAAVLQGILG